MSTEKSKAQDVMAASAIMRPGGIEAVSAGGVYTVTCVSPDGVEKWSDTFRNLVVNQGLQDMNAKYFSGASYSATWFLGLVTGPGSGTTFAASDTLASHAGWAENTAYTGNRKAVTFGAATTADPSVINNAASPVSFTMTSNAQTIAGAFLCSVDTGTSGVLFSAGDFTGGDKVVDSGDLLIVTYSFSLSAA